MSVLLKWKKPNQESGYNNVLIYRSTSETGSYTLIQTQTICDDTYYDQNGTNENWYKIRFHDTIGATYSEYSAPMRGGDFYAYCSIEDVRIATNITSKQVSDNDMTYILKFACTQLNNDINVIVEEEKVERIDNYRQNVIDGTSTTFFTENRYLSDRNNDFMVNASDVEAYYVYEGVRVDCDIESVNAFLGRFTLTEAPPSGVDLYVSYTYCARRIDVVDTLVRDAAIFATAMWCYSKLNTGKATRFHMGNLTVFRDTLAYDTYRKRYHEIVAQINSSVIVQTIETDIIF
jgi:hypothetical protein